MFYGLCRMITSMIGPNISPWCVGTLTVEGAEKQQEGEGSTLVGPRKGSTREAKCGREWEAREEPRPPCRCLEDQRSGRKRKQDSVEFSSSSGRGRQGLGGGAPELKFASKEDIWRRSDDSDEICGVSSEP